jgi:hypothetical protein
LLRDDETGKSSGYLHRLIVNVNQAIKLRSFMNKILLIAFGFIVVAIGLLLYVANTREKPCPNCGKKSQTEKSQELKFADYFKDETDFCNILTKETVSNLLGKTVIKTNPVATNTVHSCQYYINDNQAVIINYDTLNVERQKQGHEALGRKIVTNPKIPMTHFLVIQEDGLINRIYLVLGENEYVSVDRTSAKTLSEDEVVNLAAKLAEIVSGIVPLRPTKTADNTPENTVPLPQEEDIVRNFFSLIEERKPSEAVSMMSSSITGNDSTKQAWAVQYNAIQSVKVLNIEPAMPEEWTGDKHTYKLTLEVKVNPDSANAPIPYYGWENGSNIRWVTIIKENNLWKIQGLATGP